jgi:hypothetical protein
MTWLKKPASKINCIRRKPPPGKHASGIPAGQQSQSFSLEMADFRQRYFGGLQPVTKGFSRR